MFLFTLFGGIFSFVKTSASEENPKTNSTELRSGESQGENTTAREINNDKIPGN